MTAPEPAITDREEWDLDLADYWHQPDLTDTAKFHERLAARDEAVRREVLGAAEKAASVALWGNLEHQAEYGPGIDMGWLHDVVTEAIAKATPHADKETNDE